MNENPNSRCATASAVGVVLLIIPMTWALSRLSDPTLIVLWLSMAVSVFLWIECRLGWIRGLLLCVCSGAISLFVYEDVISVYVIASGMIVYCIRRFLKPSTLGPIACVVLLTGLLSVGTRIWEPRPYITVVCIALGLSLLGLAAVPRNNSRDQRIALLTSAVVVASWLVFRTTAPATPLHAYSGTDVPDEAVLSWAKAELAALRVAGWSTLLPVANRRPIIRYITLCCLAGENISVLLAFAMTNGWIRMETDAVMLTVTGGAATAVTAVAFFQLLRSRADSDWIIFALSASMMNPLLWMALIR